MDHVKYLIENILWNDAWKVVLYVMTSVAVGFITILKLSLLKFLSAAKSEIYVCQFLPL
jgi:hypothetical protein